MKNYTTKKKKKKKKRNNQITKSHQYFESIVYIYYLTITSIYH